MNLTYNLYRFWIRRKLESQETIKNMYVTSEHILHKIVVIISIIFVHTFKQLSVGQELQDNQDRILTKCATVLFIISFYFIQIDFRQQYLFKQYYIFKTCLPYISISIDFYEYSYQYNIQHNIIRIQIKNQAKQIKYNYYSQSMRKKSGSYLDEVSNIKEINILSKTEQIELQNYFKKTDQRNGGISFYDMINILKNVGYDVDESKKSRLNKEIANKEIKTIDLSIVYWAAVTLKKQKEENLKPQETEQNEFLDAFVALGGNLDMTGYVAKTTLIKTLKNEFELNFDIQLLMEGLEGVDNDKLQFRQFCELFEQEKKIRSRQNSALQILSNTRALTNSDSLKSLIVNQKDFEKYLAKLEGHQISSP